MAKHEETADAASEPDVAIADPAEPSAAALALALGRTGRDKAFERKAAEFLDKQGRMLDVQMEHLHEQRALQVEHLADQSRHLRLRHFNERLTVALKLMTAVVGLVVAVAVGLMAWQAHEDRAVVIEAFSVPPDLAQRGLTGQAVASLLLDKLAGMQARTVSTRPASSYQNNWGDDIKVEIPETGVSIGELSRFLRQWLGHESRVTGEIYRTPSGLAMTARAGGAAGAAVQGSDADIDGLISRAAEAVYAQTQPYRYAAYLGSSGRVAEGLAELRRLSQSGPNEERGWAYIALAAYAFAHGDPEAAVRDARAGAALSPLMLQGCSLDAASQMDGEGLSHWETALRLWRKCNALAREAPLPDVPDAASARSVIALQDGNIGQLLGDYQARLRTPFTRGPVEGQENADFRLLRVVGLLGLHDVTGARRVAESLGPWDPRVLIFIGQVQEDWRLVAASLEPFVNGPAAASTPPQALARYGWPLLATAYANLGRSAEATALVSRSPLDCDVCVLARGKVAAAGHDWTGAAHWFALLEARAPSIPLPDYEWARMLLARGDVDGAIAKLSAAHAKGPHFADPLELWGEALTRKGDLAGAVAKFAEADKYAPRWARNHLYWGQALMLQGRYAEARAQFEAANGLDLTRPERAALDVLLERTARGPLHG
jgi:tetratricopeptide (TPR) repeat protein